jgi:hypothetical protein
MVLRIGYSGKAYGITEGCIRSNEARVIVLFWTSQGVPQPPGPLYIAPIDRNLLGSQAVLPELIVNHS